MKKPLQSLYIRWVFLTIGVVAMLFAGIIYSWSILNTPFRTEFSWGGSSLALNFTLTMCLFCAGSFVGSILSKHAKTSILLIAAGLVAGIGFLLTSRLTGENIILLYITYGGMAGLGIGVAYNILLSILGAWFPDKKGLCSGALLMGFGSSALILGNLFNICMNSASIGWRTGYVILGAALGIVLVVSGLVLRVPSSNTVFPKSSITKSAFAETFEPQNFSPKEMIRSFTFWRAFFCIVFLAAVGNTVISFAKDLAQSVGATPTMATNLVGVLSVCNGLGRIITGLCFDSIGRRITMLAFNLIAIAAAGITLSAVAITSIPLCVVGLCLTGLSYGACPTLTSSFTAAFYGQKHYSTNMAIMNLNLMFASFIATAATSLHSMFDSYITPFALLLFLSVVALALNITIRRP